MPTGSNHRPTPRLSRLIAEQSNSLYGVTPEKAQGMVDKYRLNRDFLKKIDESRYSSDNIALKTLKSGITADESALNNFIKNR
jgi:hypothetical protein